MKVAAIVKPTHNPCVESRWASCLRENFTSSSYGEGLETGEAPANAPRQSLTRQTFHKILKSGCRAEQSKLRTAERLVNLLATFCILSWRIFWLTMLNRATRTARPTLAFTALEINLLSRIAQSARRSPARPPSLSDCLTQLARLGGYLARASDAPPGNAVIWRGLARLTDIEIGYLLGAEYVGN